MCVSARVSRLMLDWSRGANHADDGARCQACLCPIIIMRPVRKQAARRRSSGRHRARVKKRTAAAISGGMIAVGGCIVAAAGNPGCLALVVIGATVGQKICCSAIWDLLLAELMEADIWMMQCCQEHDCPGYAWP